MSQKYMIRIFIRPDYEVVKNFKDNPYTLEELTKLNKDIDCMVLSILNENEKIVGYIVYYVRKTGFEIVWLMVDEQYRHKGAATAAINRLMKKLHPERRNKLKAIIHESNLDAQLFFRSLGFEAINVRREYYSSKEDAYVMQYSVPAHNQSGLGCHS